jgi:hypothetical protein
MKYAVVFGTLALALLFNATQISFWPAKVLLFSGFLCFGGVSLAFAGLGPRVFLKSRSGRLTPLSWLIFWPYHALNYWALSRFHNRADLYSNIENNVWLGAVLSEKDAREWARPGMSILDVAGELSVFRAADHYLSLPTLDRFAPRLEDLRRGADWIQDRQLEGPVYIHCAMGHGRSATFVAAYLMRSGKAKDVTEALEIMKQQRPTIDLSPVQVELLQRL